ncbi:hypothetical protein [Fodinicola feengrottensis]|nr:hypothetical protein [Fodinicola feengrottensis]
MRTTKYGLVWSSPRRPAGGVVIIALGVLGPAYVQWATHPEFHFLICVVVVTVSVLLLFLPFGLPKA